MRSRTLVLVLACFLGGSIGGVAAIAPLTLSQLLGMIKIPMPDAAIAAEITERGVRQPVDQKMLDTVRKAGGGPATIAALDRVRPRAALILSGVPGTSVGVNGNIVGRIGDGGTLALTDLWPGRHEISGELSEHTSQKLSLTLAAGSKTDADLRLRSVYGFLSITSNAPQATIKVEGGPQFRAPLAKQRMRAGTYTVSIEAPYRQTRTVILEIPGGESIEQDLTLEPDRQALDALLVRIRQNFASRNYRTTATDAADYVAISHPADVSGRMLAFTHLTIAQLELRDYANALRNGVQALEIGGTLSLDVMHHHASGFVDPHRARLTVSKYKFQFDPVEACTFSKGSVDSRLVGVTTDSNLRMPKGWRPEAGARAVTVKLPKPNKPTEYFTLNFFDEDYQRLNAINGLLSAAVTRRRNAPTTTVVSPSDVVGRFVRVGSGSSDYLELKSDGTFYVQQQGQTATGTYSVSGNTLTLRTAKRTDTGEFEGLRLIDGQGEIWVKG